MKTSCVACGSPEVKPLMWLARQGVPPGEEGHVITYAHVVLLACGACGGGQIERLSHDCFDFEEVWDQYEWYVLAAADLSELERRLATCPNPLAPGCACPLHDSLRTAVLALPTHSWRSALEAEEHVRSVRLRWNGPLALLEPA